MNTTYPPPAPTINDPDQNLTNWAIGTFVAGIIIPFAMIAGWIMSIIAWRKSVNRGYKNTKAFIVTLIGATIFTFGTILVVAANA